MSDSNPILEPGGLPLNRISTQWSLVHNPGHFLIRYAASVRSYLEALLKDLQEADDVSQEFFLSVVANGFVRADPDRGRFRDYLKISVHNAAMSHLRRKRQQPGLIDASVMQFLAAAPDVHEEEAWLANWRQCLLERVWRAIESHEHSTPENLYHTVLRQSVDHPELDSAELADRVSSQIGRPLRADAYRKQLSRARRMFAELLVKEVAETLENATPELVEEELRETGLLHFIQPFLPPDWRERGQLMDVDPRSS
ncbi:MAG: sigma-70 family polymerase sigma factor [Planctomycetaceae bacterium]|nr:sigma-70 family polymerase sigma factor [Planctomycetaceae bacterium]